MLGQVKHIDAVHLLVLISVMNFKHDRLLDCKFFTRLLNFHSAIPDSNSSSSCFISFMTWQQSDIHASGFLCSHTKGKLFNWICLLPLIILASFIDVTIIDIGMWPRQSLHAYACVCVGIWLVKAALPPMVWWTPECQIHSWPISMEQEAKANRINQLPPFNTGV